jgi:minimal PKS chain-length factor (CLF/KS beta)
VTAVAVGRGPGARTRPESPDPDPTRVRAVVTGIGVVAPNGLGTEEYWSAVLAGESGIRPISRFDSGSYPLRVAGEIRGFQPREHVPNLVEVQTDRWSQLGLACSATALSDARLDPAVLPEYAMSVVTASSSGGTDFGQREIESLWARGPEYVTTYQSIAWFYAATTGQISIRHGLRGPCGVIASEQAGGLDALAQARRLLRAGDSVEAVLAGGTDASLCPYGVVSQLSNGRLNPTAEPARAFVPFDVAAAGYVPGEGGAMLVVENEETAGRRGARPSYGEIAGYGATFDPSPTSGRRPTLARAIQLALADAEVGPDEVDVVFADGMGRRDLDLAEAATIDEVFGVGRVPVTVPKTLTGRLYAGGAALDAATALLAMRDGVIPPTAGVTDPAPGCEGLDLVLGEPRPARLRVAVVLARGFGGFNAAMVLRRPEPSE